MFHIVTPFPALLNYAFYAPILLRIVLGLYSLAFGFSQKRNMPSADVAQTVVTETRKDVNFFIRALLIIAGLLVIAGFYTQIATVVLTLLFILALIKRDWVMTDEIGQAEIILLISISLTLMFLGAGAFAIDYPL